MTDNKIVLIVDWVGTLRDDDKLLGKLLEFKSNGIEIYICSNQYSNNSHGLNQHEALGRRGLEFDYDTYFLPDNGKDTMEFWQSIPKKIRTDAAKIVVIDDSIDNCTAAQQAGLTTVQWQRIIFPSDIEKLEELEEKIIEKGYQPS